jgi:hypothetical protein
MDDLISICKQESKESNSNEKIDNNYNRILEIYEKMNFLSEGN